MNFLRFCIIGGVGFIVDFGILYGAVLLGVGFYIGRVISFLMASICTWILNRTFNFFEKNKPKINVKEGGKYIAAVTAGGIFNYAAYSCWVTYVGTMPWMLFVGVALGGLAGLAVNFLLVSRVVFD